MTTSDKEKICVQCEGRMDRDATHCPYCASEQTDVTQGTFQAPLFQNQSLEDSLTSLYTPPYQGKRPQFSQSDTPSGEYELPFEEGIAEPTEPTYKEVTEKPDMNPFLGATVEEEEEETNKNPLWPILLLSVGVNFALLGLMQLFFSKGGVFRLEWNANFWFFYCLLAAPSLYYGYKKLKLLN